MEIVVHFKAGETVVREGERGKGFYVLQEGALAVLKDGVEVAKITEQNWLPARGIRVSAGWCHTAGRKKWRPDRGVFRDEAAVCIIFGEIRKEISFLPLSVAFEPEEVVACGI